MRGTVLAKKGAPKLSFHGERGMVASICPPPLNPLPIALCEQSFVIGALSKAFSIYPLKSNNANLQPIPLYKITIQYSYTILLETIPEKQKTITTPSPIEHRD